MSIRTGCCGKKRKGNQVEYRSGYDGGSWQCIDGFGCRKHNGNTLVMRSVCGHTHTNTIWKNSRAYLQCLLCGKKWNTN